MNENDAQREALVESIERDEEKLVEALDDLRGAAHRTFSLGDRIAERPLPWLFGGFLLGLWLAVRRRRTQ
jgi:hypothetical protein